MLIPLDLDSLAGCGADDGTAAGEVPGVSHTRLGVDYGKFRGAAAAYAVEAVDKCFRIITVDALDHQALVVLVAHDEVVALSVHVDAAEAVEAHPCGVGVFCQQCAGGSCGESCRGSRRCRAVLVKKALGEFDVPALSADGVHFDFVEKLAVGRAGGVVEAQARQAAAHGVDRKLVKVEVVFALVLCQHGDVATEHRAARQVDEVIFRVVVR